MVQCFPLFEVQQICKFDKVEKACSAPWASPGGEGGWSLNPQSERAVVEVDTVPGYVQYCSGGCPRTSVHSGSRTRVQVTLSLEQLYRNTFSQKTEPLGVLKREKENSLLCITVILLFWNTFISYFHQKQTFLSCVILQAKLSKDLTGCCHLQAPGLGLK